MTERKPGLYIALLNIHGLLRGTNLELGRDSDTGGQTKYVLELARALGAHPKVGHVEIWTRKIEDPSVSDEYAQTREQVAPEVDIVRFSCGPRRYLRKESLWPYLDIFADQIFRYLRRVRRAPDLIHAHYADAGFVGSRLASLLGAPLAFTGHSLGRVKRQRLLDQGMQLADIENRYHLGRRIDAEERALDNAAFVVTSTRQEVNEQYQLYHHYEPHRMLVIPPGVDLSRFSPATRGFSPPIASAFTPFLRAPLKPMILALSRPDPRKNIAALIHAYGNNKTLQEKANLIIVAGTRDEIGKAERGAREVYDEMLRLIDRYDLYGKVAYPKRHQADDVPDIYRLAAKSGGVFVNPALTEPFGLTLIEAAACGLPIIATNDGGPTDIIEICANGILIDPLDTAGIGDAIETALVDKDMWRRWSRSGITGARKNYAWESHVDRYVKTLTKVVIKQAPTVQAWPRRKERLITQDRMLICDIDNTLIGDKEGLAELLDRVRGQSGKLLFGIATGRSLTLAKEALTAWKVPDPDVMIVNVGSEIFYGPQQFKETGWERHISYRWKPDLVHEVVDRFDGVDLQDADGQGSRKISYIVDHEKAPKIRDITQALRKAGASVNVIFSHGMFLDILPTRASKGLAVRYFADKWGIPFDRILVAGDSGNDEEMLTGVTLGVVVGNHAPELNKLKGRERIYFAKEGYARGIVEAIDHFNFFD